MATNAKTSQEIAGRTGLLSPPKLVCNDWVLSLICSETQHWGGGYPFTLWFSVCVRSSNLIATRVRQQRFVAFLGSGNSNMFLFSAGSLGEIIQFSDGLKPPTSFLLIVGCHMLMSPADAQWIKTASWWCDKKTPFEILQDLGPNHPYVRIRVCFIGELPSLKLTFSLWKWFWVVVWNICLCSPRSLGKWSNLTCAYFSDGLVKNHQMINYCFFSKWLGGGLKYCLIFTPTWDKWSNLTCAYCSNRLMKVQTVWRFLGAKHVPVGYSPNLSHLGPFWRSWGSWVRPG